MPAPDETLYGQAMDRLFQQLGGYADTIAAQLMGGDFHTDAVDVAPRKYDEYLFEHWDDPKTRGELLTAVEPEVGLRRALKVMSPDLSPEHASEWMKMLRAGVPVDQATLIVQDMHTAAQIRKQASGPFSPNEQMAGFAAPPMAPTEPAPMAAPPAPPPALPPAAPLGAPPLPPAAPPGPMGPTAGFQAPTMEAA